MALGACSSAGAENIASTQFVVGVGESRERGRREVPAEPRSQGHGEARERLLQFRGNYRWATAGDVNGKLSMICKPYGGTFDKYPFRRAASQDHSREAFGRSASLEMQVVMHRPRSKCGR